MEGKHILHIYTLVLTGFWRWKKTAQKFCLKIKENFNGLIVNNANVAAKNRNNFFFYNVKKSYSERIGKIEQC
jgi:hypothetical protein